MLDLSFLEGNVTQFHVTDPTGTSEAFSTWTKPRGCRAVGIFVVGGGGGGGGGRTGASGTARGGGGGGGSAGGNFGIWPAYMLPDTLFVCVAIGGAGGNANGNGTNGGKTFVAVDSTDAIQSALISSFSSTTSAFGGAAGATTGGGAGGGGSSSTVISAATFIALGMVKGIAGQDGTDGGAHTGAVGTDVTYASCPFSSGAGGAGVGTDDVGYAGGSVLVSGDALMSSVVGGSAGTNAGQSGYFVRKPFCGTGGAGGGSNGTATGGRGGNGSYGCGGGGGGGGTTGGQGGRGGDGLAIIIAY